MRDIIGAALAAVLVILGLLGVYEIYATIVKNLNVQDATTKSLNIRGELAKAYGNTPGRYGTSVITPQTLINLGAVTDDMVISTTQLSNPWGGQLIVTGNGQSFFIDMDTIPLADCTTFVTNQRAGAGFISFAVGTSVSSATSATAQAVPVSPGSAGCVSGNNAVRITMQ